MKHLKTISKLNPKLASLPADTILKSPEEKKSKKQSKGK